MTSSAPRDDSLAAALAQRYAKAKTTLLENMKARGLTPELGWRISEITRTIGERTEIVMRPIHATIPAPDGIECIVSIDEDGSTLNDECSS